MRPKLSCVMILGALMFLSPTRAQSQDSKAEAVQSQTLDLWITRVSALVSLVAAGLTVWALFEARSQTKQLTKHESGLVALSTAAGEIASQLPTRDLDRPYPDYVAKITELLKKADSNSEVRIMTDVPCYCLFSGKELWDDYEHALTKAVTAAINGQLKSMQISWMNADRRKVVLKEQFNPDSADPNKWKTDPERRQRLTQFLAIHDPSKTVDSITYDEFEAIVEREHQKLAERLEGVKPKKLKDRLQLSFWIVDGVAIFGIPNFADRGRGRAFFTRDRNIIDGLKTIYTRLQQDGEDVVDISTGKTIIKA